MVQESMERYIALVDDLRQADSEREWFEFKQNQFEAQTMFLSGHKI